MGVTLSPGRAPSAITCALRKTLHTRVCFHCVGHASLGGLVLLARPVGVGDGDDSGAVCLEVQNDHGSGWCRHASSVVPDLVGQDGVVLDIHVTHREDVTAFLGGKIPRQCLRLDILVRARCGLPGGVLVGVYDCCQRVTWAAGVGEGPYPDVVAFLDGERHDDVDEGHGGMWACLF